jgi:GNAT superfamily N-acetyltransferase
MSSKIIIRKAEISDIHIIVQLIKELAEYEKLSHLVKISENDLLNSLFGDEGFVEVYLADFEGKTVGYALFFRNFSTFLSKPGMYLEDLFVKLEYRGRGIGKALLQKVISIAKERNYGRVEWSVLDWNKPAIDFYKSIGAQMLDDWKIFRLTSDKF